YLNSILHNFLNNFYSTYINNIFIYSSKSKEDYEKKIVIVLKIFKEYKLYFNPNKYKFSIKKVKYFGFIIYASVNI
ncbi:hypothetical protein NEUTE2DRAFT_50240, partial [Neurospora tetrasperma FGSC 2509]